MTSFAKRAYDHSFRLDPIVRSLLDNDFYKILMHQYILEHHPKTPVNFSVINRTKSVRLAKIIKKEELIEQLDYARTLRYQNNELVWLAGNKFYGEANIFKTQFIEFLRDFQLPEYQLSEKDDQFVLEFESNWEYSSPWEIPALSIINELKTRNVLRNLSKFELDILYANAMSKTWLNLREIKKYPNLTITDFGTRRRHSFLWQEWVVNAASDILGNRFVGTSNAFLAMKHGYEAIGTNAHELPMVEAALADNDEELFKSQYKVCENWTKTYNHVLLIALGDTFGTTQFLENSPSWICRDWSGYRVDSKDPFIAGEELINWWSNHKIDPKEKKVLFSDGLTVENIIKLHKQFNGRVKDGYGWGTNLTNDFRDCSPNIGDTSLDPISIVCKVSKVKKNNFWRSAVKLSDNIEKATGSDDEIQRYLNVFGHKGHSNMKVEV